MFDRIRRWFVGAPKEDRAREIDAALVELAQQVPAPLFWLVGKTQSGKSSIVRALTGATAAEVGEGFRPTTRAAMRFDFPSAEAPLVRFLDTRGLGEANYDAKADVAEFLAQAQAAIAVVRVLDPAQEPVLATLQQIRRANSGLPIALILTALHEAYPGRQHPGGEVFGVDAVHPERSSDATYAADLVRLQTEIDRRKAEFAGCFDRLVLVDLTKLEDGYRPADLGLAGLQTTLADQLPAAYAETFKTLQTASGKLSDALERRATPYILSSSALAAAASAVPTPWLDVPVVTAIQMRLVSQLAELYGQSASGRRFLDLFGAVGMGMAAKHALKGLLKFVPGLGMAVGAASGYAATYALGKACCWYFAALKSGLQPSRDDIRRVFREQLAQADALWRKEHKSP